MIHKTLLTQNDDNPKNELNLKDKDKPKVKTRQHQNEYEPKMVTTPKIKTQPKKFNQSYCNKTVLLRV